MTTDATYSGAEAGTGDATLPMAVLYDTATAMAAATVDTETADTSAGDDARPGERMDGSGPGMTARENEHQDDGQRDALEANGHARDSSDEFRGAVEAVIFASDEPVSFRQLKEVVLGTAAPASEAATTDESVVAEEPDAETTPVRGRRRRAEKTFTVNMASAIIADLNADYRRSGRVFRIVELAGGWTFQTTAEYGVFVGRMFAERSRRRLTQSALETLAIIAFKQPISKPAIEAIRGVNADHVLKSLLERELVTIVGRDTTVGRPLLYGTTSAFLKHFGLSSLDSLPRPREIEELLEPEHDLLGDSTEDGDEGRKYELHITPETEHLFDTIHVGHRPGQDDAGKTPPGEGTPPGSALASSQSPEMYDMDIEHDVILDDTDNPRLRATPAEPTLAIPSIDEGPFEDDDFEDEDEFDEDIDEIEELPEEFDEDDLDDEEDDEDDDDEDDEDDVDEDTGDVD